MGASARAVFTSALLMHNVKYKALLQHVPGALTAASNNIYINANEKFVCLDSGCYLEVL